MMNMRSARRCCMKSRMPWPDRAPVMVPNGAVLHGASALRLKRPTTPPACRSRPGAYAACNVLASSHAGTDARFALIAGRFVGEATLLRFYVLHCVGIPLGAAFLIAIHFWRVRKDGGISGPM